MEAGPTSLHCCWRVEVWQDWFKAPCYASIVSNQTALKFDLVLGRCDCHLDFSTTVIALFSTSPSGEMTNLLSCDGTPHWGGSWSDIRGRLVMWAHNLPRVEMHMSLSPSDYQEQGNKAQPRVDAFMSSRMLGLPLAPKLPDVRRMTGVHWVLSRTSSCTHWVWCPPF